MGTAGDSQLIEIPGTGYDGRGRQLAGDGGQLKKESGELDADDDDPGPRGFRPEDIRFFLKAVVQAVLLFGSETWVMIPCMDQALGSFHNMVTRHITMRHQMRRGEGGWDYPQLAAAMEEMGF